MAAREARSTGAEEQRSGGREEQEVTRPHAGSRDRHRIHMVLEQLGETRTPGGRHLRTEVRRFRSPAGYTASATDLTSHNTQQCESILRLRRHRHYTRGSYWYTMKAKHCSENSQLHRLIRVRRLASKCNNHWRSKKATRLLAASKNSFHETDTAFTWC